MLIPKVSDKKLEQFKSDCVGFLRLENVKISKLLMWQLHYLHFNRVHSIFYILEEIEHLEGIRKVTRTKKEEEFKREYLRGLWHKHFFSDRFIYRNIINYWEMEKKNSRKLDRMVDEVIKSSKPEDIDYWISHKLVDEPFKNKILNGACTGEWIVFAKNNETNYYLTLGKHGNDQNIYELIKCYCFTEYPFLKKIFEDKNS